MTWFSELIQHRRRIAFHRKNGTFNPPRPLDCVVLVHGNSFALPRFLETLTSRTRWPLRILLCATKAFSTQYSEFLAQWDHRRIEPHEITVVRHAAPEYPDGFNAALKDVSADVCVLTEGRVQVPDLGRICWATTLLQLMFDFPHAGWLNASLDLPPIPGLLSRQRKPVRSTRRTIIRDSPDTQLALVRRDCLNAGSASPLYFNGIYQEHISDAYYSGRAHSVVASPIRSGYSDVNVQPPSSPRFYVITRTHARREAFRKCRDSVERQTRFADIVHIVTHENDADLAYIPERCIRIRVHPKPGTTCWYETYVNDALRHVTEPGLVLVLDDDDYIRNSHLAEPLLKKYPHFDAFFFRTRLNEKRFVPAVLPFASPPYGDIASCGYVVRTDYVSRATWTAGHAGDYRYLSSLFRMELAARRIAWCAQSLTATQAGRHEGHSEIASGSDVSYDDESIVLYAATDTGYRAI